MELKRKIFNELLMWKKNKEKECLILYGPRQVGKTTIVERLGETYESFIKIDFVQSPHLYPSLIFFASGPILDATAEHSNR